MKVLFIAKNIPTPEKQSNDVILEVAKRLREQGVDLTLLYPKEFVPWGIHYIKKYRHLWNVKPWETEGFTIYPWKYFRIPSDKWAFILDKFQPIDLPTQINIHAHDLIHAHYLLPDANLGNKLKDLYGIPLIVTIRSSDIKHLKNAGKGSHTWNIARQTLNNCDAIFTLNGPVGKFIFEHFNLQSKIIPHGIDDSLYGHNVELDEKDIDILVVSSAIERKQIDWVIQAFNQYPGKQDKNMVIVGDGPELSKLKALVANNTKIVFKGRVSFKEVIQLMRRSKIFALPSERESFGRVYVEAAAQKNALIALENTGIDGVFSNEDGVEFVGNYIEFKLQLYNLLDGVTDWKTRAKQAYLKSLQLSWEKVLKMYTKSYKNILDEIA